MKNLEHGHGKDKKNIYINISMYYSIANMVISNTNIQKKKNIGTYDFMLFIILQRTTLAGNHIFTSLPPTL